MLFKLSHECFLLQVCTTTKISGVSAGVMVSEVRFIESLILFCCATQHEDNSVLTNCSWNIIFSIKYNQDSVSYQPLSQCEVDDTRNFPRTIHLDLQSTQRNLKNASIFPASASLSQMPLEDNAFPSLKAGLARPFELRVKLDY